MNYISKAIGSVFLLSIVFAHQFFISTTDIQFKPEEKRAEITIQIFTHDINLLLENANYKTIDLGTKEESDNIDIFLVNYLSDNFVIFISILFNWFNCISYSFIIVKQLLRGKNV